MDIDTLSLQKIKELLKKKQFSCVELAQLYLKKIKQINPKINAIIQMRHENEILAEARLMDELQCKEQIALPGFPITVKNGFKVKGYYCDLGYKGYHRVQEKTDATIVSRLRQEGVNILGMTNSSELCLTFDSDNLVYGRTNNPHNLLRTAGGSSGGEAAIIASGCSLLGVGSDGSGSIRQPAHCNGIVGLKPTQHLIPRTGAVPKDGSGFFSYLGTYGLMARFVEDLMYALPLVTGNDYIDPHCTVSNYKKQSINLKNIKIGFYLDNHIVTPDEDTLKAIHSLLKTLEPRVQCIEEQSPSILKQTFRLHWETFVYGGDEGQWLMDLQNTYGESFSPITIEFLQQAQKYSFTVTDLRKRMVEVDHFRLQLQHHFKNYDVIISPVARTSALEHGQSIKKIKDFSYTMTYNLMGWPSVSVNCGWSRNKMPIGVQVAAKPWCDWTALAVAKEVESICGRWRPPLMLEPSA